MRVILEDASFCDDCQVNVIVTEVYYGDNEVKFEGDCGGCNARIVDTYEFAGRESEKSLDDVEGEDGKH
jgi:hypothetical protein